MNTRHLLCTALIAAVLGVISPGAQAEMMEKDKGMMQDNAMMGSEMTGMLMGAKDHHASGTVAITKDMNGRTMLRLTDLKVDKVPDGRVYLAKGGDYTQGVELGKLTQFSGTVQYVIPATVNPDDYDSVVIWCKKFSVEIGRAMFKSGDMTDMMK